MFVLELVVLVLELELVPVRVRVRVLALVFVPVFGATICLRACCGACLSTSIIRW